MIHLHLSRLFYFLRFDCIDGAKEIPMRVYTHKALTQGKETCQESNGVGNDMMELRSGKSKKIHQEGMRRKRKSSIYVREEKDALIIPRMRLDLTCSRKPASMTGNQSLILVSADVLRRDD